MVLWPWWPRARSLPRAGRLARRGSPLQVSIGRAISGRPTGGQQEAPDIRHVAIAAIYCSLYGDKNIAVVTFKVEASAVVETIRVAYKTKVAAADVHGDIELPDKADASSLD